MTNILTPNQSGNLHLAPAKRETPSTARLTRQDWSIVALAENDRLASLDEPGPLSRAIEILFGIRPANKFANTKSETLRRVSVHAWQGGSSIPASELQAFVEAGFSMDQYELIQVSIEKRRLADREALRREPQRWS
jgi:hypothetical protein